jgi:hypothetical protein
MNPGKRDPQTQNAKFATALLASALRWLAPWI